MKDTVNLTVNGVRYSVACEKSESLLDILRDRLGLFGAKEGCGYGECGSCTVILDGEAVTACTMRDKERIDGSEIMTIEGLADNEGNLHPLQEAFVESGAVQCGFCTPGFIMRLYALFDKNPNASANEIREAMSKNLCRCTGYEALWEAALLYQKRMLGEKDGCARK
ncbi:MAG: (2Fe-2S)-binding protein [Deltaproteobacteria bacterium]|nr:(2Fe-2S)-binding protein [Deltaproteobacteria bacterium]MBW2112141.1 (2Fe-2S)-binding protein [Deltaproteobacteria bacterium]MBW2354451.1 (2Fe-2S)-binding protein [Deltaproteobacteria bacterium]HDZ89982.1 (2Fe-2S)-binding protein [Deltaproteobacteria bacterium]